MENKNLEKAILLCGLSSISVLGFSPLAAMIFNDWDLIKYATYIGAPLGILMVLLIIIDVLLE